MIILSYLFEMMLMDTCIQNYIFYSPFSDCFLSWRLTFERRVQMQLNEQNRLSNTVTSSRT